MATTNLSKKSNYFLMRRLGRYYDVSSSSTSLSMYHDLWPQHEHHHSFSTYTFCIRNNASSGLFHRRNDKNATILWQQQQVRYFEYLIDPKKISAEKNKLKNEKRKKNNNGKSWNPANRFVDTKRIRVQGGMGGKGSLSSQQILSSKKNKLRPDGGHGGNGGSVILIASSASNNNNSSASSLRMSKSHYVAHQGTNGTSQGRHGRNGRNVIVHVPPGVVVKRILDANEIWDEETLSVVRTDIAIQDDDDDDDNDDNDDSSNNVIDHKMDDRKHWIGSGGTEFFEMTEEEMNAADAAVGDDDNDSDEDTNDINIIDSTRKKVVLADLDEPGSYCIVARGGRGGLGTINYASRHGPLPDASVLIKRAQPVPGEVVHLELELKLIADVGLVGFPNAGKSSLLRAISSANPAVAPYPFTTLRPIIGCVDYRDGYTIKVADIPGLIDGASTGRGKGFEFLRHIERTKALLYIVDIASVDLRDPVEDLYVLANELESYGDGTLLDRNAIVVANKVDLLQLHKNTNTDQMMKIMDDITNAANDIGIRFNGKTIGISAGVTGSGLSDLAKELRKVVTISNEESDSFFHDEQQKNVG